MKNEQQKNFQKKLQAKEEEKSSFFCFYSYKAIIYGT